MRKKFLTLVCILFFTSSIYAKTDPLTDMSGRQSGLGSLLGTLVSGINSSSFTSGKSAKKDLISQIAGTKTSDYLQYASLAGQLAGMLKSTSFLPDWASKKDGVLDQLQTAGSIADVAGGLGGLVGNLNPSSLSSSFKKNKSSFTTALNVLSMMK